jgi:hypothetical protein
LKAGFPITAIPRDLSRRLPRLAGVPWISAIKTASLFVLPLSPWFCGHPNKQRL